MTHLIPLALSAGPLEGIYLVLSPYIDPVGLALYLRPSFGAQFREVEARLILQKNFIDDRFVMAFNIADTADWHQIPSVAGISDSSASDGVWDKQSTFALVWQHLSVCHRMVCRRRTSERTWVFGPQSLQHDGQEQYRLLPGSYLHYANQHMFATLTYLTQLPFASDYAHTDPDYVVDGRNYGASNERFRARSKFGRYF